MSGGGIRTKTSCDPISRCKSFSFQHTKKNGSEKEYTFYLNRKKGETIHTLTPTVERTN